jgi:hypothetical protein
MALTVRDQLPLNLYFAATRTPHGRIVQTYREPETTVQEPERRINVIGSYELLNKRIFSVHQSTTAQYSAARISLPMRLCLIKDRDL